jgi:hypothetical protein
MYLASDHCKDKSKELSMLILSLLVYWFPVLTMYSHSLAKRLGFWKFNVRAGHCQRYADTAVGNFIVLHAANKPVNSS